MNELLVIALCLTIAMLITLLYMLLSKKEAPSTGAKGLHTANDVGLFYNDTTDKFIKVYGEVIQAFRTNNVNDYLDYTIINAELADRQNILDAGCGIGGPASYFASKLDVNIQGITISQIQVERSKTLLAEKTLKGNVTIQQGDYHLMDTIYGNEQFDRVLFLESFGHSPNKAALIESVFKVLKPGGILYIKDLFKREHPNAEDGVKMQRIIDEINRAYKYQVADLYNVLATLRRLNFILLFVKTPEVKTAEFEHLTISNDFQELFDIARILSWDDYVFPIDFYEIKVMKPPYDISQQKHLYFLNRPEMAKG